MKKLKQRIKKLIVILFIIGVICFAYVFGVNAYIKHSVSAKIITSEEASKLEGADCILVLGCKVWDNGTPSHMLEDRLKRGIELYQMGAAPKLLMSGDHGQKEYDEVNAMKEYAKEQGIASADIFMDHAGFSTYESMYRAKEVFEAKKILIVTQEYHLYRALYIAESLGLEAYGVAADYRTYAGQSMREVREILARNKDFLSSVFKPEPTYLGEMIPVSGSGDATNDKDTLEVVHTYEGNFGTYYEMSDGTWKTDKYTYQYRLEITGRMPNAVKDTTYVYLSNIEEISFHKAMMASGLSSNTNDYFDPEEAVLVEMK